MNAAEISVLIVEDGNEYLTNLSTFVAEGMRYSQAKSGAVACQMAGELAPDLVYLDMRFDREREHGEVAQAGCPPAGACHGARLVLVD